MTPTLTHQKAARSTAIETRESGGMVETLTVEQWAEREAPAIARLSDRSNNAKNHISLSQRREGDYVRQCILAGQSLRELCQELSSGHRGRKFSVDEESDPLLGEWLQRECPKITERTARRWRACARRVVAHLADCHPLLAPVKIELGDRELYISDALQMPPDQSGAAVKVKYYSRIETIAPNLQDFIDKFHGWIADKKLCELAASVLDGERDASSITLVTNGKLKGGHGGEDRRAYALFAARHMEKMCQHLNEWAKLLDDPEQETAMVGVIRAILLGDFCSLSHKTGTSRDYFKKHPQEARARVFSQKFGGKVWPQRFCDLLFGVLKERAKQKKELK
jgi:hypothetical protein